MCICFFYMRTSVEGSPNIRTHNYCVQYTYVRRRPFSKTHTHLCVYIEKDLDVYTYIQSGFYIRFVFFSQAILKQCLRQT